MTTELFEISDGCHGKYSDPPIHFQKVEFEWYIALDALKILL